MKMLSLDLEISGFDDLFDCAAFIGVIEQGTTLHKSGCLQLQTFKGCWIATLTYED